jgi:hypothetical protein
MSLRNNNARPNVIKIEKNIPVPKWIPNRNSRYSFLKTLEVGDSFLINGDTPDYNPKSAASSCYSYALMLRRKGGLHRNYRICCRTLVGTFKNPRQVRIWRVQ